MFDTTSTVRTPSSRLQRLGCAFLLSAGGQAETVNVDILVRDACGVGGVHNAAGNGDAALHCRWDAALIQRQADDGSTVLFAERQNLFQRLSLAVDRVDDGLAVINAQCTGKSLGVRGIQLQRQIGDGLQILDELFQRGSFVDAGQTSVDVQHLGTGLGLGHGLGAGVSTVAVT